MHRIKQLLGGGMLSMRNDNALVGKTYVIIRVLNKLIGQGTEESPDDLHINH